MDLHEQVQMRLFFFFFFSWAEVTFLGRSHMYPEIAEMGCENEGDGGLRLMIMGCSTSLAPQRLMHQYHLGHGLVTDETCQT